MRRCVAAAALAGAIAAPGAAAAATRELAPRTYGEHRQFALDGTERLRVGAGPVLTGGDVVWVERGRRALVVRRGSAAGGTARTLDTIPFATTTQLAATGAQVAVASTDRRLRGPVSRLRAGTGRLRSLGGLHRAPISLLAAPPGGVAFAPGPPWSFRKAGRPGAPVAVPREADEITTAGSLLAYVLDQQVVVVDLDTGREVRRLRAPAGTFDLVLGTDGSVVARPSGGSTMYYWAPPGATELVPTGLESDDAPRAVDGAHVASLRADGLAVRVVVRRLADQTVTFVSPPAAAVEEIDLEAGVLAWSTAACMFVAGAEDGAAAAPPAGRCVRSEVRARAASGYSTRTQVVCVAAPDVACRVRVRLTGGRGTPIASRSVRVPVGRFVNVDVPSDSARARRVVRREFGPKISIEVRDGRRRLTLGP